MTSKKDQEQPEEIIQPEPAVTEKYVYLVLDWAGGDHRYLGSPQIKISVGLSAPANQEIQVAIQRPGAERVDELLRPNAISWAEYEHILALIASAKAMAAIVGKTASTDADNKKGF